MEKNADNFTLLQTLTEQDDIPWYRLNSTDEEKQYRFGITIDGWPNADDNSLTSLELHIYVGRTASSSDLEFAQIADKCPWLENKLRSFDYFQKIGLISKSQLKKVNNIVSNDLRKINGELLLYANDYYQALHKRTETVADLLAQFDFNEYNVDLFLLNHKGLFMDLIPKEVNILSISDDIRIFNEGFNKSIFTFLSSTSSLIIF